MPEYLAPGVYVEERDTGAKAIEGVSTTTSGFVGVTERGPLRVPTLVIGSADFRRQFGGLLDRRVYFGATWYLPHAVDGFFTNGGKRLYIVRVLPDEATTADVMIFDRGPGAGVDTDLAAPAHVGDTSLLLSDNTGVTAGEWLKLQDGSATEYVQIASTAAAPMGVQGLFQFTHNQGRAVTAETVTPAGAPDKLVAATAVGDVKIKLTAPIAGLAAGNTLVIGAVGAVEYAPVKTVAGVDITLTYPLSIAHAINDPVDVVTLVAGGATTLTNIANAGERMFTVADGTVPGFVSGALVLLAGATPAENEYRVIQQVSGVRFTNVAAQLHSTGSPTRIVTTTPVTARVLTLPSTAGAKSLVLDNVASLAAGAFLEVGTGATLEIAAVRSVNSAASTVTLRDPLAFPHLAVDSASDVTFALAASSATTLALRIGPGDNLMMVEDTAGLAGYAANAIVEIAGATPDQLEYRVIGAVPTITAIETGIPQEGVNPMVPVPIGAMHLAETMVVSRAPLMTAMAIDGGVWGNSVRATTEDDDPVADTTAAAGNIGDPTLQMRTTVGVEVGTILEIGYVRNPDGTITPGTLQKVTSVAGNKVGFAGGLAVNVTNGSRVRSREFKLTVQLIQINPNTGKPRVIENEVHRQLSLDPRHSRYAITVIGPIFRTDSTTPRRADGRTSGESDLIRVEDILADPTTGVLSGSGLATAQNTIRLGPDLNTDTLPDGRIVPVASLFTGGDDAIGNVTDSTYVGNDDVNPESRTGLYALKNIDEISIVAIPGRTAQKVQQALIDHCELLLYRFAVLDAGMGEGMAEVQEHRSLYDTKYGAIYHPWLRIDDPFPDNPRVGGEISIPPSGHMIGIYARSDIERGVHKAPANEVIRGINDLLANLMKEEQDILNPRNINVLRTFPGRGIRVWGVRTLSSDPDWKYINVRRLFIYIEHSIDRGTQWVVFEPNSEALWQRVIRVVSAFLRAVWRDGALMGQKAEDAYYVKCDRTTMSQNDIDNGRLIVEIGIAPVKPAEFVIFRIGQWSGGSNVDEG